MLRIWLAALGVAASGCAHRFECERHGGAPVFRVTSNHFVVTANLPAADVRREVRRLEGLWDAWAAFLQHEPAAPGRLPVLVTRDEGPAEFFPDHSGFVHFDLDPVMVTSVFDVRVGGKAKRVGANAHELVHLVSRHWLPRQPRWLAEGLAEYLGDAEFIRDDTVRFGRWAWAGGDVEPLEALWAWDGPAPPVQETDHYQSAWAWLHYLANRDEARLAKLWVELRSHGSAREAFDAVFPPAEQAALRDRVRAYVAEGRFSGWQSTILRAPAVSDAVRVEPWEVHLLRRSIFVAMGADKAAAAECLRAQEVAPVPAPPAVQLALLPATLQGPARTEALLRLAAEPAAMLQLARAAELTPDDRLRWLEKAVEALPDSGRARYLFARAALLAHDPRAVEAAQRTAALAPWSVEAQLIGVQALAAAGRCPEARAALGAATNSGSLQPGELGRLNEVRAALAAACPGQE